MTRSLMTLFAVALGVSVVIAIEMAGQSAAGSFRSSLEALAGKADLEVTATGGVPEQYLGVLSRLPEISQVEPRIEDHAMLVANEETVPLIGVDLVAMANRASGVELSQVRDERFFEKLNALDEVWVSSDLGKHEGETIELLINDHTRMYRVAGTIASQEKSAGPVVLMDIGAAQSATGKAGHVDRVLLTLPEPKDIAGAEATLAKLLPAGLQVRPQGA
ncbi:MAG: ABC transporter permease, partial [Acidobacteriales bacterium]|nr:ABC transporter permease [Terriglobales bacterium]